MDGTRKNPLTAFLSFFLVILVLEDCESQYSSGRQTSRAQSTHENAPVPADYPHQDEQFSGQAPKGDGHVGNVPAPADYPHQDEQFSGILPFVGGHLGSQGQRKLEDIRTESRHEIFLSDRVVRSVCRSLSTFAETGVISNGRVKRSSEDAWETRCGWWKSVACGSGSNDGTCGFAWVKCSDVDSGRPSEGTPVGLEDLGPLFGSIGQLEDLSPLFGSKSQDEDTDTVDRSGPRGEPGDESELNLHLPSPAEWQRRFNSTLTAVNKDDD